MTSTELYNFNESMIEDKPDHTALNKQVIWIADQNNGNYAGQIVFDTTQLSTGNRWMSWSDATIQIPLVLSLKSSVDITGAPPNAWAMGIKNGFYQLINSISVEYNGSNVVNLTNFINVHTNFKVLASFSQNDLRKWGGLLGVELDTAGSYGYAALAAANAPGIHYYNNYDSIPAIADLQGNLDYRNEGYIQRRKNNTAFPAANFAARGITTTINDVNNVAKAFYTNNGAAAAAAVYYWSVTATIRLRDLCDFFDKIPLIKGGQFRITINYNQSSINIVSSGGAGATLTAVTANQLYGATTPFMVSSVSRDGAAAAKASLSYGTWESVAGTITFSNGVRGTPEISSPTVGLTQCRLYVPSYELDPVRELSLTVNNPNVEHKLYYNDVYSFNFTTSGTGQIVQLITSGISNPQYLILVPFRSQTPAGGAIAGITQLQNPMDTAPGTTAPYPLLTNFNVQVDGVNVFQQDKRYEFEQFSDECSRIMALNGGAFSSDGVSSGLINSYMWSNAYSYYVADLSRRPEHQDNTPKSVQVLFTTPIALNCIVFVGFNKMRSINLKTGELK